MTPWLAAFAVTQAVELPIWSIAQRRPWRERLCLAFGASAVTHPFVWFVFPDLLASWWAMVVAAECFAILVEALWFSAFGLERPLLWSLLANGASFGVGLVLQRSGLL